MGSFFEDLVYKPLDLNFGPAALARADPYPDKLDLSLGVYRSEQGQPVVFKYHFSIITHFGAHIYLFISKTINSQLYFHF